MKVCMSESNEPANAPAITSKPVVILAAILLGWSLLIGLGTLLSDNPDFRKFLIIVGVMSGFLGTWILALRMRVRKRSRLSQNSRADIRSD